MLLNCNSVLIEAQQRGRAFEIVEGKNEVLQKRVCFSGWWNCFLISLHSLPLIYFSLHLSESGQSNTSMCSGGRERERGRGGGVQSYLNHESLLLLFIRHLVVRNISKPSWGFFCLFFFFPVYFNFEPFHFDSENVTKSIHNTSLPLPSIFPLSPPVFFFALQLQSLSFSWV